MLKSSAISLGREDGQAVMLVVAAMGIFLIGALGLAIDGGQMYAQRQMAQAVADAAAQAGIMSILKGTNITSANPFGIGPTPIASSVCTTTDARTPCVYARFNGFGGTASDTVTLSFPATVSGVTLSSAAVPFFGVTVRRTLQTGLIRLVGAAATSQITAKATAGIVGVVSPSCMYVLDPSAASAFQATNGAQVTLSGCSVIVDSTNAGAALVSGNGNVTASAINVVGGASISGGGSTNPVPTTGVSPQPDPFLSVVPPAVGGCDFTNYSKGSGTWTLTPGVYCGGISLHNGAIATFNPGTYIVLGALSFQSSTSTGGGVMFYITGNVTYPYAPLAVSNGASVTLSAQTSGQYLGILFFQDRLNSQAAVFNGGATMKLTGSLYFADASLSYTNGSSAVSYSTALVAKRIAFAGGTSGVLYDPTGLKTGLFSHAVALVQ
jgi:hypothetical protein